MTIISREPVKEQSSDSFLQSRQQPVFHVLVLGSLTCSVYLLYWAYKTWSLLKLEASQPDHLSAAPALSIFANVSPAKRTLALLAPPLIAAIPFVSPILQWAVGDAILIYVLFTLVIGAASLIPYPASFARCHPLISCILLFGFGLLCSRLAKLDNIWYFTSLLAWPIPCAIVQSWLNQYWRANEPKRYEVRYGFNLYEMVAIILGGSLLGLVAAGMIMGLHTAIPQAR